MERHVFLARLSNMMDDYEDEMLKFPKETLFARAEEIEKTKTLYNYLHSHEVSHEEVLYEITCENTNILKDIVKFWNEHDCDLKVNYVIDNYIWEKQIEKKLAEVSIDYSIELEDDETESGGVNYHGETVGEFLNSIDMFDVIKTYDELNKVLIRCGIKPIR